MCMDEPLELGEPDSLEGTFHDELQQLREFRNFIFEGCWHVCINTNDVWDWASADCQQVPADELDIFWMARRKYGTEGEWAFLRHYVDWSDGEPPDPQKPWFERGNISRDKYEEAKAWINEIRCECKGSTDKELRLEHLEYGKHCHFGWKIERPMYDPANTDEEGNVERYW